MGFAAIKQDQEINMTCSAVRIIRDTLESAKKPMITTNFGPRSAVLLHLTTLLRPNIPVLWVDNGYNTNATYRFAMQLIEQLNLNMHIYTPTKTTAFLNSQLKGLPEIDTDDHLKFTQEVKLEPFNRAINEIQPDAWFSAVRKDQTAFRRHLNTYSYTQSGLLKVAPLLDWSAQTMDDYLDAHKLPDENNYYDPTKGATQRECGLHQV